MRVARSRFRSAACGLVLAACSSSGGEGSVTFATWGEDFIEREIPADVFADGWTLRYDKFLVNVRAIEVADYSGAIGATMITPKLFDMTRPGVKPVARFDGLEAKAWERVSYEIGPASDAMELGAATDQDKGIMLAGGYSIFVSATATKDGVTKKLAWGFTTRTINERCRGELAGKIVDGVVVSTGGTDQAELTIHGDHFFYDDLQSSEAHVRFDPIAQADADDDGTITLEELARVKLAAIPAALGPYGTGSAAHVHDLAAFVTALSRTIGHFRGEGECFPLAR